MAIVLPKYCEVFGNATTANDAEYLACPHVSNEIESGLCLDLSYIPMGRKAYLPFKEQWKTIMYRNGRVI